MSTTTSKYAGRGGGWNSGSRTNTQAPQESIIASLASYGLVPDAADNPVVSISDGETDKALLERIKDELQAALDAGASGVVLSFRKRVAGQAPVTTNASIGISFTVEKLDPPLSDGVNILTKRVHAPTLEGVFGALMAQLTPDQASVVNGKAAGTSVSFQPTFSQDRIFVRLQHNALGVVADFDPYTGAPMTVIPVVQREAPVQVGAPPKPKKPGNLGPRTLKTLKSGQGKAPPVERGDTILMDRCYLDQAGHINMIYVNAGPTRAALESAERIILPNMMISVPRVTSVPSGKEPFQMAWAFDNLNATELSSGNAPVDLIPVIREHIAQELAAVESIPGNPAFQLILRQVGPEDKMPEIAADMNSRFNFNVAMRQKKAPGQENLPAGSDVKYVDPTVDDVMSALMGQLDNEQNKLFKDVMEGKKAGWQVEYVRGICANLSYFVTAGHSMNESGVDYSMQFALFEPNDAGHVEVTANGMGEGALTLVQISKPDERKIYWCDKVIRFKGGDGALSFHPADMITSNMHPAHRAAATAISKENIALRTRFYKEKDAPAAVNEAKAAAEVPF